MIPNSESTETIYNRSTPCVYRRQFESVNDILFGWDKFNAVTFLILICLFCIWCITFFLMYHPHTSHDGHDDHAGHEGHHDSHM